MLALLVFFFVTVVVVPGVMQQSEEVVEEVVGMWQIPSLFTGLIAVLLLLVCVPGGPLAPVVNNIRNF